MWSCPQCTLEQSTSLVICCVCDYANQELIDLLDDPSPPSASTSTSSLTLEEIEQQQRDTDERMIRNASASVRKQLPESDEPSDAEEARNYSSLQRALLSSRWLQLEEQQNAEQKKRTASVEELLSDKQVIALFRRHVKDFDSMMDRRSEQRISALITSTYNNGLPLYNSLPAIKLHMRDALRAICHMCDGQVPDETARKQLARIADAFRACQAEQGRVIDAVYGALNGRERSLLEQVLSIVHEQHERVLEQVVNHLHPDAWKVSDANPAKQIPHLLSSYRVGIGRVFGIRGVDAAAADYCATALSELECALARQCYRRLFSIRDLIATVVADINQQAADAERYIDRDTLTRWVSDPDENSMGFDAHSIYYDDENKSAYDGEPADENMYQPFVNRHVVLHLLLHLFKAKHQPQ
jgi:hypothetical protein